VLLLPLLIFVIFFGVVLRFAFIRVKPVRRGGFAAHDFDFVFDFPYDLWPVACSLVFDLRLSEKICG